MDGCIGNGCVALVVYLKRGRGVFAGFWGCPPVNDRLLHLASSTLESVLCGEIRQGDWVFKALLQ